MPRPPIRQMKRQVTAGSRPDASVDAVAHARESALSLLARSVACGHTRLAIMRLATAVQARAVVPAPHWDYCRDTASRSADSELIAMFLQAEQAAAGWWAESAQAHRLVVNQPRSPDQTVTAREIYIVGAARTASG